MDGFEKIELETPVPVNSPASSDILPQERSRLDEKSGKRFSLGKLGKLRNRRVYVGVVVVLIAFILLVIFQDFLRFYLPKKLMRKLS